MPSQYISEKLELSESYTKKIIRKLVNVDLISSSPGNSGGLQINKSLDKISLLDIYLSLEEPTIYENTHLSEKIFVYPEKIKNKENILISAIEKIQNNFFLELSSFKLSEILKNEDYQNGYIDWKKADLASKEGRIKTYLKENKLL